MTTTQLTVEQALQHGIAHHQAGRLAEAEQLYGAILKVDPRHFDSLHMLGVVAHQVGRNEAAVDLIGKAIEINPNVAACYSNLGLALTALGRFEEAIAAYNTALRLDPDFSDAHSNLGIALKGLGRLDEAVAAYTAGLRLNPLDAKLYCSRGVSLSGLGRLDEAVAAYRAALRLKPDFAEAHTNLGNALKDLGRLDEAVVAHRVALRLKPDFAEAHSNLGGALYDLGRSDEAVAACAAALRLKPDLAEAHYNLGNARRDLGCLDMAVIAYSAALRLKPDFAEAHTNLGDALQDLGRLDEAVAAHRAALKHKPDFAEAYSNLGCVLRDLGRSDEAVAACAAALRLKPDSAKAHHNLGNALRDLGCLDMAVAAYAAALRLKPDFAKAQLGDSVIRLLLGDFAAGWAKYEWRWRGGSKQLTPRNFIEPQWRGEDLAGRTILLHAEQGLGDAIQFCRYAPLVAACGGQVILEAPPPLLRLFSGLEGIERVVAAGDPLPEFDCYCPLMSLPGLFGTDLGNIPPPAAFPAVDPNRIAAWRDRLAGGPGYRIGIVWQGNPAHQRDRWRSVPLQCFAPLACVAGARLINLQKGHGLDQLDALPDGMRLVDLGPEYASGDFAETAAVLSALDLVVTIDSAVAHLAGSLGRPTWVALPFSPDWRWLLNREDSPWYPSLRLFRQSQRGEWSGVFDRMAAELERMIAPT